MPLGPKMLFYFLIQLVQQIADLFFRILIELLFLFHDKDIDLYVIVEAIAIQLVGLLDLGRVDSNIVGNFGKYRVHEFLVISLQAIDIVVRDRRSFEICNDLLVADQALLSACEQAVVDGAVVLEV